MKEMVDRILDGEAVNLAGLIYNLSVLRGGKHYYVGFCLPEGIGKRSQILSTKDMKEAGNLLIELAKELESRKKFKDSDHFFFVSPKGDVLYFSFNSESATHLGLVMSGNAFKTRAEAEEHKEEIMAKFQELIDKGLV